MEVSAQEVKATPSFLYLVLLLRLLVDWMMLSTTRGWWCSSRGLLSQLLIFFQRQPLGTHNSEALPVTWPPLCPKDKKSTMILSILHPSLCRQHGCWDADMTTWISLLPVSIKLHLTLFPDHVTSAPSLPSEPSKGASFSWLASTQGSAFLLSPWGTVRP